MEELLRQAVWSEEQPGDQAMQTPEDVQAQIELGGRGPGTTRTERLADTIAHRSNDQRSIAIRTRASPLAARIRVGKRAPNSSE